MEILEAHGEEVFHSHPYIIKQKHAKKQKNPATYPSNAKLLKRLAKACREHEELREDFPHFDFIDKCIHIAEDEFYKIFPNAEPITDDSPYPQIKIYGEVFYTGETRGLNE